MQRDEEQHESTEMEVQVAPQGHSFENSLQLGNRNSGNHRLEDYQMHLMLLELELQHTKRLHLADEEQGAIHNNANHAEQDYQMQIVLSEQENKRVLLARKKLEDRACRTMEISEGCQTTVTPARFFDGDSQNGAHKRKRGDSIECQSSKPSVFSAGTSLDAPEPHASFDAQIQDGDKELPPHFDLIYQVHCHRDDQGSHSTTAFRDQPIPTVLLLASAQGDSSNRSHLNGTLPVSNLQDYLDDETGKTAFVVVRTVDCTIASASGSTPLRTTERLYAKSRSSKFWLKKIAKCHFEAESTQDPNVHRCASIEIAPLKLFLFHHCSIMEEYFEKDPEAKEHVGGLSRYSESRYGKDFDEASALFARNLVNQEHVSKLFRPNEVIVAVSERDGHPLALVVRDWPQKSPQNCTTLVCWSYQTDGIGFSRKLTEISIPPIDGPKSITSLVAYPIRFAKPEMQEMIRANGRKQWSFRSITQIMYKGWNVEKDKYYNGSRFMIDHRTYRKMHEDSPEFNFAGQESMYSYDDLPVHLESQEQYSQEIMSLLSPTIHGFDLQGKRWINLRLDSVHYVPWNKKAYDRLQLPIHSKDLLRTLVLVQRSRCDVTQDASIAHAQSDIIKGEGSGLTVRLHGGPGSGKLSTAEAVAELAEMPLYRVTYEANGANADAVQNELDFILGIGKAWKCVLLIEKAHTFFTARPASDPKRDHLISSLSRVLKYYNGIVILTSSRVDVFDEAITSQIRVSFCYGSLDHASRKRIWQNFIDVLEEEKWNANFEHLRLYLDELAENKLNGHQIRNVLRTAKDISAFRSERLDGNHLVQALLLSPGSTSE